MTLAYFDCFAGSGGDMIVAALIDAGADLEAIRAEIGKLGVPGVRLEAEPVRRCGMAARHFRVHDDAHDHAHRHLGDIVALIDAASLPERAADRARRVFRRLAEAEAAVHGIGVQEVHFHEVGAVDSIVDIVGACVALELLGVDRVICSPIAVGSGWIQCDHGRLPVPAPATARLLVGAPTRGTDIAGEATTPTAAALLTTLAESFGPMPSMHVAAVGCGAGTRDSEQLPNVLRVFLGEPDGAGGADTVIELSANLDDCTGEVLGATIEKLLAAGCLDAWATPAVMKKSRPAWVLSALCSPADAAEAERLIFTETTTFGVRRRTCTRTKLLRRHETVETPYGPVRIKLGERDGRAVTASPEFEDCRRAAEAHHVSVRHVMAAAETLYRTGK